MAGDVVSDPNEYLTPEDILSEANPDALLADGLEEAYIGYGNQHGKPPVAIYDAEKCVEASMKVLDLFYGLGGFSQVFRDRGHDVTGVDIIEPADLVMDVRTFPVGPGEFDVVIGSPPCTEFSRWDMPWCSDDKPSMELVEAFLRIVDQAKPRYWCMENVRGLKRFWDKPPTMRCGSRYLWGNFPLFLFGGHHQAQGKEMLSPSPDRARIRAKIPKVISRGICLSMEAAFEKTS